jgi:AbrB family looped-hinge helix DNA binding protein
MYPLGSYAGSMGKLTDTKISEKNLTTVPKPVRNFLGVGAGDRVEWHVEDGRIVVEVDDGED